MTPRVFCGTFEAEAYWREADLAKLPSLPDKDSPRIVQAMDEMLFAFCGSGDTIITAHCMEDSHADYLHSIGFQFRRNSFDLSPPHPAESAPMAEDAPSIFQRMLQPDIAEGLEVLCPVGARLDPFMVLPGTAEVAGRFRLRGAFPLPEVIRRVNTKSYALEMRDRLGIENVGVTVEDVASLLDRGSALLQRGPILVKDDYGVSGKGNQLIETHRTLQRIAKHLASQVAAGKRVRFVVEPYLPKSVDFSCQFRIEEDAQVRMISVQMLANNGLAFGSSHSVTPAIVDHLERDGYSEVIQRIGSLMYGDGYWGDVCVDSMILAGGVVAPVVEINARKSMSLIKHAVDQYLQKVERKGLLTYVPAVNDRSSEFSALLEGLGSERLLFTPARASGVLPLTCRTMYPRSSAESREPLRGRLYVAAVFQRSEDQADLLFGLRRTMQRAGLHTTG